MIGPERQLPERCPVPIEFTLILHEEHIPVEGNAMASGDDEVDRKAEQWIYDELNRGNAWAWCTIEVRATYKGVMGSDYLGCCSYRSEGEFRQPDGYYQDMKEEALVDLERNLRYHQEVAEFYFGT